MTQPDPKTITHWLKELETPYKDLTKWEEDFIGSIEEQWNKYHRLSDRQVEILERIYAEKTN